MNGCPDRNRVRQRTGRSAPAESARNLVFERVRRIMELPLKHVYNEQFEAWRLDRKTENQVLAPLPACRAATDQARPRGGTVPYFSTLYETPLLTSAQEIHLFRKMNYLKYKAGALRERLDPRRPQETLLARIEKLCQEIVTTRNHIIACNLRLVVAIAKRYVGPAQNILELISDGNVSLMRAVERFDYALGNRFSTYASWAITNNFARTIHDTLRRCSRFRTDYAEFLTMTPDVRANWHEREAVQFRCESLLEGILGQLNHREREIILCRFGLLHGQQPQTLQELGNDMGVSKERIRQIEARALGKLRKLAVQKWPSGLAETEADAASRPDGGDQGDSPWTPKLS